MKTRRWEYEHDNAATRQAWIILGTGLLIVAATFYGILWLFGQAGARNSFGL